MFKEQEGNGLGDCPCQSNSQTEDATEGSGHWEKGATSGMTALELFKVICKKGKR